MDNSQTITAQGNSIYQIAKSLLGHHITLDQTVPPDLGCAEAVSYILKEAGIVGIPVKGFASTALLEQFLLSSDQFELVASPSGGAVIISPSGQSSIGYPHGHVGICGEVEQGIMSNDSDTGLFLEKWSVPSWKETYGEKLGFPVKFFRAK